MLLRWSARPQLTPLPQPQSPEAPVYVLAAPGSVGPRQRFSQVLAAGSLLALAFRPLPRAVVNPFTVTNLSPSGNGSLAKAIQDANTNPGADTVTFQPGLSGTILLAATLVVSESVQIIGPGPGVLAVSGSSLHRVFYLTSTANIPFIATISGLTIRDGRAQGSLGAPHGGDGAGILADGARLTLDNVAILNNTAISNTFATAEGGGVDIFDGQTITAGLTIRNSIISGNKADYGGGVLAYYVSQGVVIQRTRIMSNTANRNGGGVNIFEPKGDTLIEDTTISGNTAGRRGGGVWFYYPQGGSHIIRRTTISGNSAFRGGGLYIRNVDHNPLLVENSTISGNHAGTVGGVMLYNTNQQVRIQNTTVFSNSAAVGAGGIEVRYGAAFITNTIIAGNLAPLNQNPDISGTFDLHYDLVQVTGTAVITDAGGNVFGLDPLLGPLRDNGGPTQTHYPGHTSPAVNAGDPAFAPPPATDQRGRTRVVDGRIDIGAVETQKELFLPLVKR